MAAGAVSLKNLTKHEDVRKGADQATLYLFDNPAILIRAKFGTEVAGMGVDLAATANTYAKKDKAKKRFQDKSTRKALVAFVASGTHREIVVKKKNKVKPGK